MISLTNHKALFIAIAAAIGVFAAPVRSPGSIVPDPAAAETRGGLGVIKGIVRDRAGSAIADATVAIFRVGTSQLIKQVRSASDGSFIARIVPGRYTVLAVAEGFNPITLAEVDVNRSAELYYGFDLERAGLGNTLPEKRVDRNNSKWRIRSAALQRSIYQTAEGAEPIVEADAELSTAGDDDRSRATAPQTVVETYFAGSASGGYTGLNFAALLPAGAKATVVLAGQTGSGRAAPQRLEASVRYRPRDDHQFSFRASAARIGAVERDGGERSLGQVSFQALDEWTVREGLILVAGLDYSRFVGAGNDAVFSPRVGVQFDINAKTRFRGSYATQTEKKSWSEAIELEGAEVAFQEPQSMNDIVVERGRPRMDRSSRFEFGIERVLDNRSSIEAAVFADLTLARGVGLSRLPFDALDDGGFAEMVGNQQGKAQGFRLVYSRRLGSGISAGAGYSFGSGQRLSSDGLTDPSKLFESDFFQTMFGRVDADFKTGTSVRTILRLSPRATVFAVDPFQGRLAIYDPSLSVLVIQKLPTLGLPFNAQAIVDARNLFDFQTGAAGDDGVLRLNSQGRALRGGILVKF
ncbi:MAG: carboxypeptidase regulatory-like domain-containing protein [Pyrinomonadaceae bacterium]